LVGKDKEEALERKIMTSPLSSLLLGTMFLGVSGALYLLEFVGHSTMNAAIYGIIGLGLFFFVLAGFEFFKSQKKKIEK
jgi:hypothetical protein